MNCGGGDENGAEGGSGGHAGTGGRAGAGGKAGGAGGKAGGAAVAGSGGTAVAGAGGGAAGAGGSVGGTPGTGGNTDGGTPGLTCPINTFDTTTESFALDLYMNAGEQNLANAVDGGAVAVLSRSATAGDPTAGALEVTAPFSDYNQFINIARSFGMAALKNWTGAKLHVRLKVVSGGNQSPSNPAGVQPYATSYNGVDGGAAGYNFKGAYANLKDGNGWNDYVIDLAAAGNFDPSKIVQYGVILQTGNGVMGDGGINPLKPTAAVVQVDSIWIEGTCPTTGAGGSGGGTAGAGGGAAGAGGGTAGAGGSTGGAGGSAKGGSGGSATAGSGGSATAGAGGSATAGSGGSAAGSGGSAAGSGGSAAGSGGSAAGSGGSAAGSGGSAAGSGGSAAGAGGSAAGSGGSAPADAGTNG